MLPKRLRRLPREHCLQTGEAGSAAAVGEPYLFYAAGVTAPWTIEMTTTRLPENADPANRILRCLLALLVLAAILAAAASPRLAHAAAEGSTSDATLPEATPDPAAAPDDPHRHCEVPPEVFPTQDALPGLTRAMKDGAKALTIVVLGSLSGGAKSKTEGIAGFAPRLQVQLQTRFAARGADVQIRVETVGKTRALAGELATLIKRQVLALKPVLVIWQVGRADARQGNPPHRFSQSLADGLDILQQQGIDTILADIQFHPQFEALYRTDDYRNYLRWLAGKRDLPLLQRYEMIEHWALSGRIDLDSGIDADQRTSYEFIQECVAYQAANMIVGGAGLAPR